MKGERLMCLVHEDRGAMAMSAECRECYGKRALAERRAYGRIAALEQALREVAWQALYRPKDVRRTALAALRETKVA